MKLDCPVHMDPYGISILGTHHVLLCGSLFYFRIPAALWRDRIRKLKSAGYNCCDVYFPWNYHETRPDEWDFSGERDVEAFLEMLAEEGLYCVARPGPYICSEWDGGAIPAWLLTDGTPVRSADSRWMKPVSRWFEKIVPVIAAHQVHKGGSVIMMQLENELDFFDCPDPATYMGALAGLARKHGMVVPLFGCAGQGSAVAATGFAEDVVPTFNFYPNAMDPSFDHVLHHLGTHLQKKELPYLITETGREHFLLRREMAFGARLLGAYNQVGGTNFGFTTAINNWGKGSSPLSFLTSNYDFDSMIDAAGDLRKEAGEGRLLGGLIESLGEPLARATTQVAHDIQVNWENPPLSVYPNGILIKMNDNASLLCLENFLDKTNKAEVITGEGSFVVTVGPMQAPMFPLNLPLNKTGLPACLVRGGVEILHMAQGKLMLYAETEPSVHIRTSNGGMHHLCGFGRYRLEDKGVSVEVSLLTRQEAVREDIGRGGMPPGQSESHESELLNHAVFQPLQVDQSWKENVSVSDRLMLEHHGIWRGGGQYHVQTKQGTPVLLQGVADLLCATCNGRFLESRVSAGQWQLFQGTDDQDNHALQVLTGEGFDDWDFRVTGWGHSNFDDSRLPSLRIASGKGMERMFQVDLTESDLMWRFRQEEFWLPERMDIQTPGNRNMPDPQSVELEWAPILSPNRWNSTRMPLLASYTTCWTPQVGSDAQALSMEGMEAEVALYVNGNIVGVVPARDPWLNLTGHVSAGEPAVLTLLCRKRDWSEPAGQPCLYNLTNLSPRMLGESEQDCQQLLVRHMETGEWISKEERHDSIGSRWTLTAGERIVVRVFPETDGDKGGFLKISGKEALVTVLFNGHLLGRVFTPSACRPDMTGGSPEQLYLPGPWFWKGQNQLLLLVEALADSAMLESVVLLRRRERS